MNQNDAGLTHQQQLDRIAAERRQHQRGEKERRAGLRLVDWLNDHLYATFDPPPIGPYGDVAAYVAGVCPVCSHPMGEHIIDRSTPNAVLICLVPHEGQFEHIDDVPLNEVGMPRHPV